QRARHATDAVAHAGAAGAPHASLTPHPNGETRVTTTPHPHLAPDAIGSLRAPAPSWVARCVLAAVVIFSLRAAQTILVPLVIAVVLPFVLAVPVRRLRAFGVPEVVGAGLMVSALVVSGALLAAMLVGPATDWTQRAPASIAQLLARVDDMRRSVP